MYIHMCVCVSNKALAAQYVTKKRFPVILFLREKYIMAKKKKKKKWQFYYVIDTYVVYFYIKSFESPLPDLPEGGEKKAGFFLYV